MALPDDIRAEHVRAAFRLVRDEGIPVRAASTKFDVIDPEDGARYPPKVILSIAAQIAIGTQFSRRGFSGGEETNARLRDLGFEVARKPGTTHTSISISQLCQGTI